MSKILLNVLCGSLSAIGAAVFYWSGQLSSRYNAWTTGFRARHPQLNPPPTTQMRQLNTEVMTWLFRLLGAFLVLLAILALVNK
jgi:hypothetical protein